jgi:hypothetical protein
MTKEEGVIMTREEGVYMIRITPSKPPLPYDLEIPQPKAMLQAPPLSAASDIEKLTELPEARTHDSVLSFFSNLPLNPPPPSLQLQHLVEQNSGTA